MRGASALSVCSGLWKVKGREVGGVAAGLAGRNENNNYNNGVERRRRGECVSSDSHV